ncbi:hypothetical protein [Streptomyces roseolilacinus]|uniref:Uncharacterized protein n=1 Tax=Streptomyces roseolilacinus TaxID=66904 RepID=A0A918AUN6_9ACTN|nr:hypothetical protein [Streptomyces roseolilacinus]GGP87726.1 hypothetical protein GCM10010249_01280 [Streptomyces roseolilacinus]
MSSGHGVRRGAAVTTALALSLVSVPAAAGALPSEGHRAVPTPCTDATQPVRPAQGFEGLYELFYNVDQDCATLTNISARTDARNGRVLLLTGQGEIMKPIRWADMSELHWIRQTTARAAEQALAEQGDTGSVVILPDESVSYSPADARYYNIRVADAHVTQAAKVSESLAAQAAVDAFKNSSAEGRSGLTNTIATCAIAAKQTWREVEQNPSNAGLSDVLTRMTQHPECKNAYAAIDAVKRVSMTIPKGEQSWRQKMKNFADQFDDVWSKSILDDAKKAGRIFIRAVP